MKTHHLAAAILFAAAALPAQPIIAQLSGLANPAYVVNFGANLFPNFTPVADDFPPLVVTHARYFTTGVSNNLVGGFLTNDPAWGQPNTMSIQFPLPITDVSFVYHQIGTYAPSTIRALLSGTVVDSFTGSWNQSQPNNYFGFLNTVCDEVQIDFVGDFNVDTVAFNSTSPLDAQCVTWNGSGVNPVGFSCATLPVLGTTWQGAIAVAPNTVASVLAYADAGFLPAPVPLFGGELLIDPSGGSATFTGLGSYSLAIPSSSSWIGVAVTFQAFRLDVVGLSLQIVPLNANQLVLGI